MPGFRDRFFLFAERATDLLAFFGPSNGLGGGHFDRPGKFGPSGLRVCAPMSSPSSQIPEASCKQA